MALSKEVSLYVTELMDRLGYSYDQIKCRQHMYSECDKRVNDKYACCKRVTIGGRGEGTTICLESDMDAMNVIQGVACADNPQHYISRKNITLFQTERQTTAPGYTRLKLVECHGNHHIKEIRSSLFESETCSMYLSSAFFLDEVEAANMFPDGSQPEAKSGPSTPYSNKYESYDIVKCFKADCPDIIERWVSRSRYNGWPTSETIHEISLLDGHVVPIGCKGSMDMYREWRICYSLAELRLLRDLNETQLKVYIILKQICKSVLKPVCKELTSYIMKNVVLWICETKGKSMFTRGLTLDRLFECIAFLSMCVGANNLPSYMIPERNLLAGRLDMQQRKQLTSLLSDLRHEEGRILLRISKFREAMIIMYKTPNMFRRFGEKRDELESLKLVSVCIHDATRKPGMSKAELVRLLSQNKLYKDIKENKFHVLLPDVHALAQSGKTRDEIRDVWRRRYKLLFS